MSWETLNEAVKMESEAVKVPEVEILLRELYKESSILIESLKGLEARLQSVLLPDAPQPIRNDMATGTPAPPHSAMYSQLNDIRYTVTGASILINNIKQRLEV